MAMNKIKIWKICDLCHGEGTITQIQDNEIGKIIECPSCHGEKKSEWGFFKLKDIEGE